MALVNQVQKRVKMPKWDVVKFQILTHCYINHIAMSESDLNCLTLLSFNQPIELTSFCYDASAEEEWIFKSPQTVRNCVNKAEKNGLIVKDEKNKKIIMINPNLKIQTKGNILLDYKFLGHDTQESV
ncbi:MAG: hypothetical protein NTY55_03040 [Flavobacteriia bacterium]|jgi:hypothetical protein|nr:hypothetical protein [Flavobacteriia bacterium]